jgi:hypothetical protein
VALTSALACPEYATPDALERELDAGRADLAYTKSWA